jgi:NAD(P)-dependent dehydrogenase (short-subunit alcohol dehydrogenase family)
MSSPESNTTRLAGRRALVTGATRRLGAAIAERLGREGAVLALHYRSDEAGRAATSARLEDLGLPHTWLRADLGTADGGAGIVERAVESLGGLDILVNNAATFERTPIETMTVEDFDRQMAVNARSVFALSQAAGLHMRAQGGGAIVNLADVSAERPWPTHIPYCASKAAVVNMTRGFARALAPSVRVNAVAPGSALPPEDAAQGSGAAGGLIAGHSGADAVAAGVSLLLRASYVTGVVLAIDGGRSVA